MSTWGSRTRKILSISFEGKQSYESDCCYSWPIPVRWALEVNGIELAVTFRRSRRGLRGWTLPRYGSWHTPWFTLEFDAGCPWFNELFESIDWPNDEVMRADEAYRRSVRG